MTRSWLLLYHRRHSIATGKRRLFHGSLHETAQALRLLATAEFQLLVSPRTEAKNAHDEPRTGFHEREWRELPRARKAYKGCSPRELPDCSTPRQRENSADLTRIPSGAGYVKDVVLTPYQPTE